MSLVGKWMKLVGKDWGPGMPEGWLRIRGESFRGLEARISSPSWRNPNAEIVIQVDHKMLGDQLIVSDLACRCATCSWLCSRCRVATESSDEHTSEGHICQGAS